MINIREKRVIQKNLKLFSKPNICLFDCYVIRWSSCDDFLQAASHWEKFLLQDLLLSRAKIFSRQKLICSPARRFNIVFACEIRKVAGGDKNGAVFPTITEKFDICDKHCLFALKNIWSSS